MKRTQIGPAAASMEQLYHQHKDMVYSIALATVQDPRDAEDITLYTFRQARNILNADPSGKHIASQLLDIVSVESLRTVSNRNNGIPYVSTQNCFIGNEQDDFLLPIEYARHSELKGRLMQVIDALPVYQRMALVMYVYNHLTLRAAASAMRCSEYDARAHLCTAKATVKQQLDELAHRSGGCVNSAEMVPFHQVYTGLIAGRAMSSSSASYIWDALQQTVDRNKAVYAAPVAQPKGMSTGSKIALWLSTAASVLVLVTVCAVIGFSPKASTETPPATEVETVIVKETVASSSSKTTPPAPRVPVEPRQPLPKRYYPAKEPKVNSSASSKSDENDSSAGKSSSKESSASSSPSSSTPSSKDDDDVLTESEILGKMAGTYNEQRSIATDDFYTIEIKSDGTISLFSMNFRTADDPSGYRYATISDLTAKKKGIYSFAASNGDAPLSGTKFTYYAAGTAIADLPFSSSYFETDGSVLKKAVIVDSYKAVYK